MTTSPVLRWRSILPWLLLILAITACGRRLPSLVPSSEATAFPVSLATPIAAVAEPARATGTRPALIGSAAQAASTPSPAEQSRATPAPANDAAIAAIKSVLERANQAQQDAFNTQNPSLMRETSVADYYAHLAQVNRQLAQTGVTEIKLIKIEWGPIAVQGNTATATTYETWRTTYDDHSTDQERAKNEYTLTLDQGVWRIASNEHPDVGSEPESGQGTPSVPTPPAEIVPAGPGQSRNWSGYAAAGGTYTEVSGRWEIPRSDGGPVSASSATWVGIGGVHNHDLIQAGTEETVIGPDQVRYSAWIEMLPAPAKTVPLTVNPGDTVSVEIRQQSPGEWQITISNQTTGKDYQTTVQYDSSLSSAEWIHEAPSSRRRVLPLDDFGTIPFQDGETVKDGKRLSIAEAGGRPITMIDRQGQIVASPSPLDSTGSGFTIDRITP